MNKDDFFEIRYPAVRQFTADTGVLGRNKHDVRALLEVDVSQPLVKIKELRAQGKKISFLAWFIKVLADVVAQHPPINGIRKGRHKVVVFRNVNISTVVEKQVDGTAVPLALLLRDVNHKSMLQISDEIQAAIQQPVENEADLVLGQGENRALLKLALGMPQWLRLGIMRTFILKKPQRMQDMMGTVMVTSLGAVGGMSGWIIPASMHPLSLAIGSLTKKPVIQQGEIHKRSVLNLTVAIDHDVIDGMPALRFAEDLVARLQKGEGLDGKDA